MYNYVYIYCIIYIIITYNIYKMKKGCTLLNLQETRLDRSTQY